MLWTLGFFFFLFIHSQINNYMNTDLSGIRTAYSNGSEGHNATSGNHTMTHVSICRRPFNIPMQVLQLSHSAHLQSAPKFAASTAVTFCSSSISPQVCCKYSCTLPVVNQSSFCCWHCSRLIFCLYQTSLTFCCKHSCILPIFTHATCIHTHRCLS